MVFLKRKRILLPGFIFLMLIAAYAQKIRREKETITGYIQDAVMDEASGIAASTTHPGIYYIHNDSGDTSRFFAITPEGKLKTTYYYKGDPTEPLGARDCEDIAVGPGPDKGKSYIYLGDIGDNRAERKYLTVYRFEEQPAIGPDSVKHVDATPLYIKYPDGAKDAETLMVDPVEQLLYIVSKRKNSVIVYTTPLAYKAGDTITLTKRSTVHLGGIPPFKWVTAGDISKDGSQILLRNYNAVYYWKRPEGMPVWQVMTQKPTKLYYKKEKQGEAIGFTPDGKGYYTASEGIGEPIYYYHTP
ncbi:MAG: hypothetical protein V4592_22365 [Bacteroidota bacterium]